MQSHDLIQLPPIETTGAFQGFHDSLGKAPCWSEATLLSPLQTRHFRQPVFKAPSRDSIQGSSCPKRAVETFRNNSVNIEHTPHIRMTSRHEPQTCFVSSFTLTRRVPDRTSERDCFGSAPRSRSRRTVGTGCVQQGRLGEGPTEAALRDDCADRHVCNRTRWWEALREAGGGGKAIATRLKAIASRLGSLIGRSGMLYIYIYMYSSLSLSFLSHALSHTRAVCGFSF